MAQSLNSALIFLGVAREMWATDFFECYAITMSWDGMNKMQIIRALLPHTMYLMHIAYAHTE